MLLVLFHAVQERKTCYAMNKRVSFFRLYRVSCIQSVSLIQDLSLIRYHLAGEIYHDERECVYKSDSI